MLVKKFEARSMRDALNLVKHQLGPEAVILAARENNKGFGLVGESSYEVTAAISEDTFKKKQLAEAKLNVKNKEKYTNSSAKRQKEFIRKAFSRPEENGADGNMGERRYIDIDDDHGYDEPEEFVETPAPIKVQEPAAVSAETRIKSAIQQAMVGFKEVSAPEPKAKPTSAEKKLAKIEFAEKDRTIIELQDEIKQLKSLLGKFNSVPQSFVSMHPGADYGVPYELSFMYEKLTKSGLSEENAVEILKRCQKTLAPEHLKKKAFIDAWVARYLLDNVAVINDCSRGHTHVFVGPAGQGKTTSMVKFASHLVIKEKKKVAIVTADIYKVGAAEQLKIYAQILNVPYAQIDRGEQWPELMKRLKGVDHILVDMPGSNLKTDEEYKKIVSLIPSTINSRRLHYVQSILTKDKEAFDIAERYRRVGFDDVIFTRLDEAAQHGLVYNFQKQFAVPLHSFGLGTQVPEDYEYASKERVVDLIFKLSKIRKDVQQ